MQRFREALSDSEECIRLKPDWPRGYLRKGKALLGLKKASEAVDALKKGLDLDPANESLQTVLKEAEEEKKSASFADMFRGEKLRRLKAHPKTAGFFTQPDFQQIVERVQMDPTNTAGLILDQRVLACFQVNLELELEAIKTGAFAGLNNIFKSSPLGDRLEKAGIFKPDPVPKAADEQRSDPKREAEEAKLRGNEEYKARHFPEALQFYDKAIALYPSEPVYYTNKAAVLLETEEYKQCVAACEKAVAVGRQSGAESTKLAKAFARMGIAFQKDKNAEGALKAYKEAMTLQPTPEIAATILKLEAELQKHPPNPPKSPVEKGVSYSEPLTLAEKAEKCNAEGTAAFKKQHYSEAEQRYSEAIDLNPTEGKYLANRSAARIKEGNLAGALRDIDRSVQLNPNVIRSWNRKGFLHRSQQDWKNAVEAYYKALGISEDDEEARQGFVECAQTLYAQLSSEGRERTSKLLAMEEVLTVLEGKGDLQAVLASSDARKQIQKFARLA